MTRPWDEMRGGMFDSRDVIERIEELEDTITFDDEGEGIPDPDTDPDLIDELNTLRGIAADAENEVADWQYGATFIPEHRFTEYAQQLAEDIGAIDPNAEWPLTYIDWEAAALALQQDYSAFTFDGFDYLARA